MQYSWVVFVATICWSDHPPCRFGNELPDAERYYVTSVHGSIKKVIVSRLHISIAFQHDHR